MSHAHLSRRSILAGIALSAPVVALPSVAAVAVPAVASDWPLPATNEVDPVFALVERAMRTHDAFTAACRARHAPDGAMTEWLAKNPAPNRNDYWPQLNPKLALHFASKTWFDVDAGPEGKIDPKSMTAEELAGVKAFKTAHAKWRRRKKAAERRTGLATADVNEGAASHAASEARDMLRDTVPTSFAGFVAKVKAARYIAEELDDQVDDLFLSLADDNLVTAGEIAREAVRS